MGGITGENLIFHLCMVFKSFNVLWNSCFKYGFYCYLEYFSINEHFSVELFNLSSEGWALVGGVSHDTKNNTDKT